MTKVSFEITEKVIKKGKKQHVDSKSLQNFAIGEKKCHYFKHL